MAIKVSQSKINLRIARLLDANLNRAREGLRVVEETARFIWEDEGLYKRLRSLRHRLDKLTRDHSKLFLSARQSETDSGRLMSEGDRDSLSSVVLANLKRAQEASRVLEEYSKVFAPNSSAEFKKVRFELYIEEKKILKKI